MPGQKNVKVEAYTQALTGDIASLRLGIVSEGFAWPGLSEQDVDQLVDSAARLFSELGMQVSTISIPLHRDGIHIWNAIAVEGTTMMRASHAFEQISGYVVRPTQAAATAGQ